MTLALRYGVIGCSVALVVVGACTAVVDLDGLGAGAAAGGASASSAASNATTAHTDASSSSGSTGGFGGGGGSDCIDNADCGTDSPCATYTCTPPQCSEFLVPSGVPLPNDLQTMGDCQLLECDGNGNAMGVPADNDVPPDLNFIDCQRPACSNGAETVVDEPNGKTCNGDMNRQCCAGVCCPPADQCLNNICV